MFLIEGDDKCGINPFFPAIVRWSAGEISVMEWKTYRARLPFLIVLDAALLVAAVPLCIGGFYSANIQTAIGMCALGIVGFRNFTLPTVSIERSAPHRVHAAPLAASVDHVLHFLSLTLLCGYAGRYYTEGWLQDITTIFFLALLVICLMPLANLAVFIVRKKSWTS